MKEYIFQKFQAITEKAKNIKSDNFAELTPTETGFISHVQRFLPILILYLGGAFIMWRIYGRLGFEKTLLLMLFILILKGRGKK